jgi:hypothetical protein
VNLAREHQSTVGASRVPENGSLDEAEKRLVSTREPRRDELGTLLRFVRLLEMTPEVSREPDGHGEISQHEHLGTARSGA